VAAGCACSFFFSFCSRFSWRFDFEASTVSVVDNDDVEEEDDDVEDDDGDGDDDDEDADKYEEEDKEAAELEGELGRAVGDDDRSSDDLRRRGLRLLE